MEEEEEEYMRGGDAEEGKDTESRRRRRRCCFKNIWEPSGSGEEKRWTQLNRSAPLTAPLAFPPALYPTNTSAQKTEREKQTGTGGCNSVLQHAATPMTLRPGLQV